MNNKKIVLVAPKTLSHRTSEETIALGYLASYLRNVGWEVDIIDAWLRNLSVAETVSEIEAESNPWLIGFSCYYSNLQQATDIMSSLKARNPRLVSICGGFGPTFHDRDFLLAGFDVVVRGESENMIVDLVDAIAKEKDLEFIPGISFMHNGEIVRTCNSAPIERLDLIPMPARDEIRHSLAQKNFIHICSSRGCSGKCTFCSVRSFSKIGGGKLWRGRSILNIVDELEYVHDHFGVRYFKFVDDSFIDGDRDQFWVDSFASEIIKRRLDIIFRTQVRADRMSEDIVHTLKQAGWFSTSIGVENGSESALRRMKKSASPEHNSKALHWLKEASIYTQMGMILFDELTTVFELVENLKFLRAHNWVITKGIFTEMFAAVGTEFSENFLNYESRSVNGGVNLKYDLKDSQARRVYLMLKRWHSAHSVVYDWVIDSLTSPKILTNNGYGEVYALSQQMYHIDLEYFERVISLVSIDDNHMSDSVFVERQIIDTADIYGQIEDNISWIYKQNGLTYNAVANPFL